MTRQQVMAALQCSERTLRRYHKEGRLVPLPKQKPHERTYYKPAQVFDLAGIERDMNK